MFDHFVGLALKGPNKLSKQAKKSHACALATFPHILYPIDEFFTKFSVKLEIESNEKIFTTCPLDNSVS